MVLIALSPTGVSKSCNFNPMEEDIDVPEEIQAPENSNVDEEFGMHGIVE